MTDMKSVEDFRQQAREWLSENMERVTVTGRTMRGLDHITAESVVPERALQRKLYEAGYAGIAIPAEYGGQGLTPAHESAFLTEANGYRMPAFGVLGGTTFGVCLNTMLVHGTPEFLARHVPPILAGDRLVVQFFSEPGAGSDLAGVTTRADRDGDNWVLNGSKIWSSGAYYADWGMCLARTDWDQPKHRGLTWFAVPCDAKGLTIEEIKEISGDSEFCQEFFDDVMIGDEDRIGDVNEGWRVSQTLLVFERGADRPAGEFGPITPEALAPDLVALAERLGRTGDTEVRQLIAEAHTNDFAQKQLAARIAQLLEKDAGNAGVAAYGKLASGTFGPRRAKIGMQVGRSAALSWDPGDREAMETSMNYLNGRVLSIAGGTNEVQRNGIAERALGLPREPAFDLHRPFREVAREAGGEWKPPTT
jgi:alkylation response protein AidB-like acyl-CoA dehydrogenase